MAGPLYPGHATIKETRHASKRKRSTTDGIQGQITALGHEPHNYVMVYIQVGDINTHLEQVVSEGGQKALGPVSLTDGKQFGWIKDPEGNMLGLVTKP